MLFHRFFTEAFRCRFRDTGVWIGSFRFARFAGDRFHYTLWIGGYGKLFCGFGEHKHYIYNDIRPGSREPFNRRFPG